MRMGRMLMREEKAIRMRVAFLFCGKCVFFLRVTV